MTSEARTSAALTHVSGGSTLPAVIFAGLLTLVWISPEPFKVLSSTVVDGGNIVNQIAFSLAALMAMLGLRLAEPRAVHAYLRPSYLLLIGWLLICVVLSINPAASIRAFGFTLVVLIIAGFGLALPNGERQFALMLGLGALTAILVCYAGLGLYPEAAMHSANDVSEPEHAGAWRGLFDHKNVAGPMMASFAMIGLYVAGRASVVLGWGLVVLSVLFLSMTGAKTSIGLFPAALMLVWVAERIHNPLLRGIWCLTPILLLLTFTIGSVLLPPVKALLDVVSPGQTFTGRTELWQFVFDHAAQKPIFGFGFEAFWGSELVRNAEQGETDTGIAQGMVHGHNSYLDMLVSIGLPGLMLVSVVLLILPLVDYQKARRFAENDALARLYLRLWLYGAMVACLESFFFRRADPVWFTLILSVLGMRLISLWRVTR
ncbi:MAG: O-antigen ligase family protein [Bosea sp. (in: a-proteobacteria)]